MAQNIILCVQCMCVCLINYSLWFARATVRTDATEKVAKFYIIFWGRFQRKEQKQKTV